MVITITKLHKKHLPELEHFLHLIKNDFVRFRRPSKRNALTDYLSKKYLRMLLAFNEKNVDGYAAYDLNYRKMGRIIGIGILPAFRRKGVGSALVKRIFSGFKKKKISWVVSRTWSSNHASQRLLESHSFEKYRVVKNDRENGESTFWYRK